MMTSKRLEGLKQRFLKQSRGLLIAECAGAGLVLIMVLAVVIGSPGAKSDGSAAENQEKKSEEREAETLFGTAVSRLNNLHETANDEETLHRIVNHLNQWIEFQQPDEDWTPDQEIAELSAVYLRAEEKFAAVSECLNKIRTTRKPDEIVQQAEALSRLLPETVLALETINATTNSPFLANVTLTLQGLAAEIDATLAISGPVPVEQRAARLVQGDLLNQLLTGEGWADWMAATFDRLSRTHDLDTLAFPPGTEEHLQTSLWLRGIADWVPPETGTALDKTISLFDWTVRNIDLVNEYRTDPQSGEPYKRPLQTLGETLILGRGTRADRAWLFVSLLRRIGVDAAVLNVPDPEGLLGERSLAAVGVLINGDVYLFEPGLGLPFVAPGGLALTEQGLEIRPATLTQALSDPGVCAAFNVGDSEEEAYPVGPSDIAAGTFGVVLDPLEVSLRMRILESKMSGENKLVLTSSPLSLRERFSGVQGVQGCVAWSRPLETVCERAFFPEAMDPDLALFELAWIRDVSMWEDRTVELEEDGRFFGNMNELEDYKRRIDNPLLVPKGPESFASESPLRKGRIYYFLGLLTGEESAAAFLQEARPPERQLNSEEAPEQMRIVLRLVKLAASYSLGQVAYSQGNLDMAVDCFLDRTILTPFSPNIYLSGAAYNLARSREKQGRYEEALRWYASNTNIEVRLGGQVRSRLLSGLLPETAPSAADGESPTVETPGIEEEPEETGESEASVGVLDDVSGDGNTSPAETTEEASPEE